MLKSFRTNKKIRDGIIVFVSVLLASYVLVGFGSAPPQAQGDTIAKLGSTKIKLRDAWIQLANIEGSFRQLDKKMVDQFTVSQLVNNAIMIDGAQNLNIKVSDEELRDYVIRSRTLPDGRFLTNEEWSQRIKQVYRVQEDSFEEYVRLHNLQASKFRDLFYNSAYVSEKEILDRFTENNQKVKLEMLAVQSFEVSSEVTLEKDEDFQKLIDENPEEFKSGDQRQIAFVSIPFSEYREGIDVTEEEIRQNYESNRERYLVKEQVQASHILIKTEKRSDEEALQLAQKVKQEVEEGLDFAEAATKYSEDDGSKTRGGDLGFFQRGQMVKPFEEAAFAMVEDTVSNPVKSTFGYHVIKKIKHQAESQKPLEEVSGSIKNNIVRTKSKDMATEKAQNFYALLESGKSFEEAAGEMELEVQTSTFFDSDNNSDLGSVLKNNFQVRRAAFELENLNDFSTPLSLGQETIVFKWVAQEGPRTLTLADDANRVKRIGKNIAAKAFILKGLAQVRQEAEASPDKKLTDLRGKRAWLKDNHFKTTDWVDANTLPYEIRSNDLNFQNDLYALEIGQFYDKMETSSDTRFALVRVIEKQDADMSKLEEERFAIIDQLRAQKAGDLLSAYVFNKRNQYDSEGKVQAAIEQSLTRR